MAQLRPAAPARLLALGALLLASAAPLAAKEKLVPANFQSQNDGLGQDWSVDQRGTLQVNRVGQVMQLQVNGVHFSSTSQLMTADGREYVLEGACGNLQVTRRVRVQEKLAGCRVVDVIRNPGAQAMTVTVNQTARMNMMPGRPLTSDQGQALSASLGKKDRGLYVESAANVTVFFGLAGRGSKVRPSFTQRHNYELIFSYQVKVPAKSEVALTYAVAKQNGAPNDKQRADIFRDFGKQKYLKDLPREVKRKLINGSRGLGPEAGATLASLEEELGLVATASHDVLAFGQDTRVRGTAHLKELSITSRFGQTSVPFERVAALAGESYAGGARIHFKDGQKLSGQLSAEGLRFEMTTGLSVDLHTERLDRLVIRREGAELTTTPPSRLLVETVGGDRLMVKGSSEGEIGLATRWGVRKVPSGQIKSLVRIGEGQPGFWVTLQDRSRFRAFFSEETLSFEADLFGPVRFHASEVMAVYSADARRKKGAAEEEEVELLQPHLILAGGDVLVGMVDLEALHFAGTGEVLPVPPAQIKLLVNALEGEPAEFSEGIPFKAELWGGGEVSGVLREALLPIQTGDGRVFVPVREVLQVSVPTPQIPPALRERIAALIRQLGDASWQKREAASRELKTLGELARLPLEEARDQTRDPEIERRVKALLGGLEER